MQSTICINFKEFLPKGATRPFLAMTENEDLYVVKAHGNPLGAKVLFNEYITGVLAREIGVDWPKVQVVSLSRRVIDELERNNYKVRSEYAVGIEFIKGIEEIKWPPNVEFSNPKFNEINARYILESFPDENHLDAFYGKSVIDNWLLIEDTTYDTLHKNINGRPIFLDASIALGGLEWDETKLSFKHIFFETSPYLCGFKFDMANFEPWINKIDSIKASKYNKIINGIPYEWGVPSEFIKCTKDYFYSTKTNFIADFKEAMEFEMFSKQL